MIDPQTSLILAAASLAGLGILATSGLAGWRGWLALRQAELDRMTQGIAAAPAPSAGGRIEIADLRERIRKLEAIAAGVDL